MNNFDAHAILNAAKSGANVSKALITECLKETGDLDPIRRAQNVPYKVTHSVPKFTKGSPLPTRGYLKAEAFA